MVGSITDSDTVAPSIRDDSSVKHHNMNTETTTGHEATHHHNHVDAERTPMGAISDAFTEKGDGVIASDDLSKVEAAQDSEDGINYPHGLPLFIILMALCLAVFLVALDQTIIAVAIPRYDLKSSFSYRICDTSEKGKMKAKKRIS